MNTSLLCLFVIVGTAAAFWKGSSNYINDKATAICEEDEACLANIEANARTCIFALKKGSKWGHGGRWGRGRGRGGRGSGRGGRRRGGQGRRRGQGNRLQGFNSYKKKMHEKFQTLQDCFEENNVDSDTIAELETLRKWQFKKFITNFFTTLEETNATVAEDIRCCIGQNMSTPFIGEERELLIENIEEYFMDKIPLDEQGLLDTYLGAITTCADSYTECRVMEFKNCTVKECIKNLSTSTTTDASTEIEP